jgi:ATP synthase protein I
MTTETATPPRDAGTRVLVRAALATTVIGLLIGALTVHLVATVMPAAALLVALLTYALQVAVMAMVFVALSRSGLLDGTVDRAWLSGTVIAGTAVWLVVQVVLATTRRIPVYELADRPLVPATAHRPEGGAV